MANSFVSVVKQVFIAFFLTLISQTVIAQVTVEYTGCVNEAKSVKFASKVSLLEIINNADTSECAYLFGASLQKQSLKSSQSIQKQQLLSDLETLLKEVDSSVQGEYLYFLKQLILHQPVTGRQVPLDFQFFNVKFVALKNKALSESVLMYFPVKPSGINLIGFDKTKIKLNSMDSIGSIYTNNDVCSECEKGWLWLIQPDGTFNRRKVGYWTHEEFYIAPGGWLISELVGIDVEDYAPGFYKRLASWIATQVIK
jgi:hypothetical protein